VLLEEELTRCALLLLVPLVDVSAGKQGVRTDQLEPEF
jgi:hypothetical protein